MARSKKIEKKIKITKAQINRWGEEEDLLLVIMCRKCNKLNEIRKRVPSYNCKCGKNIIIFYGLNYLWGELIYKNKNLSTDSLKNYC